LLLRIWTLVADLRRRGEGVADLGCWLPGGDTRPGCWLVDAHTANGGGLGAARCWTTPCRCCGCCCAAVGCPRGWTAGERWKGRFGCRVACVGCCPAGVALLDGRSSSIQQNREGAAVLYAGLDCCRPLLLSRRGAIWLPSAGLVAVREVGLICRWKRRCSSKGARHGVAAPGAAALVTGLGHGCGKGLGRPEVETGGRWRAWICWERRLLPRECGSSGEVGQLMIGLVLGFVGIEEILRGLG